MINVCFFQNISAQEKVFFGNLHSHTSYSDGLGTPQEAYTYARNVAKIDFLALTEHNHAEALGKDNIGIATNPSLYKGSQPSSLISTAKAMTVDGKFVALYGQEFSTISSGNHVNIFDIGEVINIQKGRYDLLLDFLQTNKDSSGQSAVMLLNHPEDRIDIDSKEYGFDDFGSNVNTWVNKLGKHASLIQIINGPGDDPKINLNASRPKEDIYRKFLSLGFRVAPTADQDNHQKNWGNATNARTAAVTTDLTKTNILEAMRKRHIYATEDPTLKIIIKVNNRLCGDIISPLPEVGELNIFYQIEDKDEKNAQYEIEVWRGKIGGQLAKVVSSVNHNGNGNGIIEDVAFSGEPQFFFFKVIQRNESNEINRAWTSPVWFDNQVIASIGTTSTTLSENTAVASKKSEVFHLSEECLDSKQIKSANKVKGVEARNGRRLHEGCPRKSPNQ
ncbi:MAG: CehA/McbA family metallohydrolase [Flavobacterium sp.]|nr:CehA/McbA family metallohydrolase [Flavobacterium sp.]